MDLINGCWMILEQIDGRGDVTSDASCRKLTQVQTRHARGVGRVRVCAPRVVGPHGHNDLPSALAHFSPPPPYIPEA